MTELEATYRLRRERVLVPLASHLESHIRDCIAGTPRIDRVVARAKTIGRFIQKAEKIENEKRKYGDPLSQIQDQVGARIVTFYLSDVPMVNEVVRRYFNAIESKKVVPDGDSEFGYEGQHYILLIPTDVLSKVASNEAAPECFELQIKTLFQHAWSEAGHDIAYKVTTPLSPIQKRKVAFTAAQAWGADQIFDGLVNELGAIGK